MKKAIYLVRKNGSMKVDPDAKNSKERAEQIQAAAAKEGYNFGIQKQGWNWLVIDLDV